MVLTIANIARGVKMTEAMNARIFIVLSFVLFLKI